MLFYVGSVKYGYYGCADDILKAYPNITNCTTEEIETTSGIIRQLAVEINAAKDILRFSHEVEYDILIKCAADYGIKAIVPSILIYDGYIE